MKAVVIEKFGGEDQLKLTDIAVPVPGPAEVLIEIKYTSVNPVDWMIRKGLFKERVPHRFPVTMGWDAAGVVEGAGVNASHFHVGDRVYAYCRKNVIHDGTYAEYITLEQDKVALMPQNMTFREAATVPLAGLTAWQGLFDHGRLKAGETVLILGGAGGVGGFAVQFAKAKGAKVLSTARSEHHAYLRSIGADRLIDYTRQNINTVNEEVDLVLDLIGSEEQERSFSLLRKNGRLVSTVGDPDQNKALQYGVQAVSMFVEGNGRQLTEIAQLIEAGKVKPPRIEEFELSQAALAQKKSESHHIEGKLVLKCREDKS
jgi:NADPH2:quinone reductase